MGAGGTEGEYTFEFCFMMEHIADMNAETKEVAQQQEVFNKYNQKYKITELYCMYAHSSTKHRSIVNYFLCPIGKGPFCNTDPLGCATP